MQVIGAGHLKGVKSDNFIQIELPQKEPALADTIKRGSLDQVQKTPSEIIHINNEAEDEDVHFLAELEREN